MLFEDSAGKRKPYVLIAAVENSNLMDDHPQFPARAPDIPVENKLGMVCRVEVEIAIL